MLIPKWLRTWLGHPRHGIHLVILAVLLGLPSLWLGWQLDDYVHRAALLGVERLPETLRSWWQLFAFIGGDPQANQLAIEVGDLPWWSSTSLRLSFFRPVTGLTHWLDYRLWPNAPVLMHIHSLLWYALGVLAVTRLYRALSSSALAAGLAALLFTIDDSHGTPVVWIANRNMVIALVFAALALLAHVRWREKQWRVGAWVSPLALLLALLAAEAAIATCAYILAYAVFLDRGSLLKRARSLVPAVVVAAAWLMIYKMYGYGATGSGLYIDPGTSPLRYLGAVAERAPRLLWGQWAWPPSDVYQLLSERGGRLLWIVSIAVLAVLSLVIFPLLRNSRVARFWAAGMLLSVLPVCAVNSSDRLLMFVGIGAMGLLGQFLVEKPRLSQWGARRSWHAPVFRITTMALLVVHLVIAPFGFLAATPAMRNFGGLMDRAARSLPSDNDVAEQQLFILQTPTAFLSVYGPVVGALDGRPAPRHTHVLGSSIYPIEVERSNERTLVLRPQWGFLAPSGLARAGLSEGQPLFEPLYMLTQFDRLFRDVGERFKEGEQIELAGLTVEVAALTDDGRPAEVIFTFDRPLEDPSYRWVRWKDGVYVAVEPPAVGELLRLRLE